MKKIAYGLMAGAIMLLLSLLIGILTHLVLPEIESEYKNTSLFRPWSDPRMWWFFVHTFSLALIMAFVWSPTKDLFKDKRYTERGLRFGFLFWIISLPGLMMSYSTFPLTLMMTFAWALSGLIQVLFGGYFFSKTLQ